VVGLSGSDTSSQTGSRWYAVVLHWGRTEDTARCVLSLDTLGFQKVLVVDNGTGARELDDLAASRPALQLIRNAENRGYGAGNNVGLRAACEDGAEFVAVVNNDAVVEYPAMLSDAESVFRACASIGVLSPPVFFQRHGWVEQPVDARLHRALLSQAAEGGPRPAFPGSVVPTSTFAGCCWMAPAAILAKVGPLREDLFLYHEELEYSVRLRRAGLFCGRVGRGRGRLLHWGGTARSHSPEQAYFCGRNVVLLLEGFSRRARRRLRPVALATVARMVVRSLGSWQWQSAWEALHGLADGFRGRRGKRSLTA
jgi:GT2 family glycosyltransferase